MYNIEVIQRRDNKKINEKIYHLVMRDSWVRVEKKKEYVKNRDRNGGVLGAIGQGIDGIDRGKWQKRESS